MLSDPIAHLYSSVTGGGVVVVCGGGGGDGSCKVSLYIIDTALKSVWDTGCVTCYVSVDPRAY